MLRFFAPLLLVTTLAGSCQSATPEETYRESTLPPQRTVVSVPDSRRATSEPVEVPFGDLTVEILDQFQHDPGAWTQGYAMANGQLFESTGDWDLSDSTLREIDRESGEILRSVDVGEPLFSEGIEIVGDQIFMITWQDNVAFTFDRETFAKIETFSYAGEGWGLCLDGDRLVMSDGSETITFRNPETFEVVDTLEISHPGNDFYRLNELECVDGYAFANVWLTDLIVRIDLTTGEVVSTIDASILKDEIGGRGDILNGIAYDEAADAYLLTGKQWPTTFVVRFVER